MKGREMDPRRCPCIIPKGCDHVRSPMVFWFPGDPMSEGDAVRDFRCSSAMRSMLLKFSSRTGFVRTLSNVRTTSIAR